MVGLLAIRTDSRQPHYDERQTVLSKSLEFRNYDLEFNFFENLDDKRCKNHIIIRHMPSICCIFGG